MRLIDADALERKYMSADYLDNDTAYNVITELDSMPTIEPERKPQWISCRERLPNDDGEVLVSTHDFVCRGFYAYGKWYGCSYGSLYDVTAWMPLPSEYREVGDQDG